HVVDHAEVDVAGDRPALRPLEVDLCDLVVLEYRDALLAGVDRHEQLALGLRERRAPRRRAAPGLRALARLPLGRLLFLRLLLRCRALRRLAGAIAPSARAAAALLRCGRGLSVVGRRLVDGQCFNFEVLRGSRERRLICRLLAPEPRQWQTISPDLSARAASPLRAGARRGCVGKALA